jgi:hypothetical protein
MRACCLAAAFVLMLLAQGPAAAPRIYSQDPNDPWNRIFAALFTRVIHVYETDEHPRAGPFAARQVAGFTRALRVSVKTFDRYEEGDRAVEALYPSFLTGRGVEPVLREPGRSTLLRAVNDALAQHGERPALDRALMQSDLWSAFDALSRIRRARGANEDDRVAAAQLAEPVARLIGRLALSRTEIDRLPDNYSAARASGALPDLFAPGGAWMEVEFGKDLLHDSEDGSTFRQAARVFIRPPDGAHEAQFLSAIQRQSGSPAGAALVRQILLVDTTMHVVPAPLMIEVQTRTFDRHGSAGVSTTVAQFELSRRRIRSEPGTGGFTRLAADAPAYVPMAGNDYGFATPEFGSDGPRSAILTTLGTRCTFCHGPDGAHLMGFSLVGGEDLPPPIRFSQPNDIRARYVAVKKEKRPEFADLLTLARQAR